MVLHNPRRMSRSWMSSRHRAVKSLTLAAINSTVVTGGVIPHNTTTARFPAFPCYPEGWLRPHDVPVCPRSPVVNTQHGPVIGFTRVANATDGVSVSSFYGIAFAKPPVGDLRLRAPQPTMERWTEPILKTAPKPQCMQSILVSGKNDTGASEDCLYLNVYAPAHVLVTDGLKLPVLFWIYGGAFMIGDAFEWDVEGPTYDGAVIAGPYDAIVVTHNYRLGGLGFFAADELRAEDPEGSTGNLGVLDQRMALRWVQENIAAFCGDPRRVTIFGESAGGWSVIWHLVSQPSWPLFHHAAISSGSAWLLSQWQPYAGHAQEFYRQWAERLGCPSRGPDLAPCLRALPAWKLVDAPGNITIAPPTYDIQAQVGSVCCGPVIDGSVAGLLDLPINMIRKGEFHKVPLLLGSNHDEGTLFEQQIIDLVPALHGQSVSNLAQLKLALGHGLNASEVQKILDVYPERDFNFAHLGPNFFAMLGRMVRDLSVDCSNRAIADTWAAHGLPVYMYVFSPSPGFLILKQFGRLGITHGFDVPYWWHYNLDRLSEVTLTNAQSLATSMSCKLQSFFYTGSPGRQEATPNKSHCSSMKHHLNWPVYNQSSRRYYEFHQTPSLKTLWTRDPPYPHDIFPSDRRCDVMDTIEFHWSGVRDRSHDASSVADVFVDAAIFV